LTNKNYYFDSQSQIIHLP